MGKGPTKAVDLLNKIRGPQGGQGLRIIKVVTTEPAPVTFVFEGSNKQAIDLDIFEIPVACYPLKKGDRLFVYPLIGEGASQRWGAVENLNGGLAMATMQSATSLKIDGVDAVYGADRLIIPPYFAVKQADSTATNAVTAAWEPDPEKHPDVIRPLKAGDRVAIAPTWNDGQLKYVVINKY